MSALVPLIANFDVVSGSASDEVTPAQGGLIVRRRLSLVLRAYADTEIQLVNGEPLSSIQTHLTLASDFKSGPELERELTPEDVGFMVQTAQTNGAPFVHGIVVWPDDGETLPYYLLSPGIAGRVQLTIASLAQRLDYENPDVWETGRKAFLRLSSYSISCTNGEGR